jgi:hypothetical protein
MIRILVRAKGGVHKYDVVEGSVYDGDHVFSRMCDISVYRQHFGSDDGWPGDFVIVEISNVALSPTFEAWGQPKISTTLVPDPDLKDVDNEVITIDANSQVKIYPIKKKQ